MLLVYPQHAVHIIEGSWELLTAVIRDSCEMNASRWARQGREGGGESEREKKILLSSLQWVTN